MFVVFIAAVFLTFFIVAQVPAVFWIAGVIGTALIAAAVMVSNELVMAPDDEEPVI